ncbi:MAG: DUF1616 domain-containing protein [Candidatus Hydrothermarchaeales archaeon]
MSILEIIRAILGFALVFFIPGYALTLALWPKTKREVYEEILKILKGKGISNVTIAGRSDNLEDLGSFLDDNKIEYQGYDRDTGEGDEAFALIKDSENLILMDSLNIDIDQKDKFIIDLANTLEDGEKIVRIEDTIDGIERLALSFGLSIALVPLLGLLLDKLGFGIRLGSILVSLMFVILIFFGIYFYRRRSGGV